MSRVPGTGKEFIRFLTLGMIWMLTACSSQSGNQVRTNTTTTTSAQAGESGEFKRLYFGPSKTSLAKAIRKYTRGMDRPEVMKGTTGLLKAGEMAVNSDDYYAAEEILSEVIRRDPNNGEAYFLRGRARHNALVSDDGAAKEDLEKAVTLGVETYSAYKYLVRIYADDRENDKAIAALSEMIKMRPDVADAYRQRATLYVSLGRTEEALHDYNQALKFDPGSSSLLYARAQCFEALHRVDEAISDYQMVNKIEKQGVKVPFRGLACQRLAAIYSDQGKHDKALGMLSQILAFDKEDDDPWRLRGDQYMLIKNYKAAIDDYSKAIDLAPESSRNYQARSAAYAKMGQAQLALRDKKEAERLQEKPAEATLYELK